MNQLVPITSATLPALAAAAGERASMRFLEFFAANIRNPTASRVCSVISNLTGWPVFLCRAIDAHSSFERQEDKVTRSSACPVMERTR